MSTYHRRGHYRRGPNGQQVWVSAHDVTRGGGKKYFYTPPKQGIQSNNSSVSAPRSRPARWAEPNASCPVCGAPVYFYRNEAGSKVYFDEIGPPWPKHPCIDLSGLTTPVKGASEEPQPTGRASWSGGSGYTAYTVHDSVSGDKRTLLRLERLHETDRVELWDVEGELRPRPGQLIFASEISISYFDLGQMSVIYRPAASATTPSPGVVHQTPDSAYGCGGLLLVLFIPILTWLVFGFWGPGNHSLIGVIGGTILSIITALGLLQGFALLAPPAANTPERPDHQG